MAKMPAVSGGGGEFTKAPPGTTEGIAYRIIDLGTQTNDYLGEVSKKRQIFIGWELPFKKIEVDGKEKPHIIGKFYTWSSHEKARLRIDLEAWLGRKFATDEEVAEFDLNDIIGKGFTLSLVENQNGKINIQSIAGISEGVARTMPHMFNLAQIFYLDEFIQSVFDELPKGFQEMIKNSPEYEEIINGTPVQEEAPRPIDDLEDEIPF